ncbi:MAG: transposase [bacterium]|nr:transposase [bacterium]
MIENALEFDNELLEAYSILQDFYILSNDTKYEEADFELDLLIKELEESNIDEFNKLSGMFKNWKKEIINSFISFGDKRLSNGPIEGMNNHIKTIKRVGFGFKDFSLFRNRLMYIVNKPKIK